MKRFLRRNAPALCAGLLVFAYAQLQGQNPPAAVTCTTPPSTVFLAAPNLREELHLGPGDTL